MFPVVRLFLLLLGPQNVLLRFFKQSSSLFSYLSCIWLFQVDVVAGYFFRQCLAKLNIDGQGGLAVEHQFKRREVGRLMPRGIVGEGAGV